MDIRTVASQIDNVIKIILENLPASNQQDKQHDAAKLYIGKVLEARGKKLADPVKKTLATSYAARLKNPTDGPVVLEMAHPFAVTCKVAKGRESFDKDMFIKTVAETFELSASQLQRIAATCNKTSAPPKTFDVQLTSGDVPDD